MATFLKIRTWQTYSYFLIVLTLFFFILNRFCTGQSGIAESLAATFAYPVIMVKRSLVNPFHKRNQERRERAALQEEVNFLRLKNQDLLGRIIALEAQFDFIAKSKELIAYSARYNAHSKRMAQIIARHKTSRVDQVLVDCGSRAGVEVDMVAVVKNCIIGKVIQVFPFWSRIALMGDGECKVAAYCARSKAKGIYEGENNGGGSLKFVSHLASIAHNDLVLTSGEGLVFPQGFGIGYIDQFEKKELTYDITVKPLIEPDELDYCYLFHKGELQEAL